MSVWVVVPAYNEAENLGEVVPRIMEQVERLGEGGRVVVVDDGSTDETPKVLVKLAEEHPGVMSVSMGTNRGKAAALQRGFGIALDGGADVIAMMDADGQDDPDELGGLVARLETGADLVTGARAGHRRDRFVKRTTSVLYNRVTGWISGAPGRDFNSGYKVMRAEVARQVAPMMYGELHRYLTVIAHWLGFRVTEVPVEHHPRLHGSSKYGLARFWRGFIDLLTVRFLMSYEHRPSHLFSGAGLVSILLGGVSLVYLLGLRISGATIGDRPLLIAGVLLVVVGAQLVLFGLLAELQVYNRHRAESGGA